MKKIFFIALALVNLNSWSQSFIDYGIKGGINYNSNGDLTARNGFDELFIEDARGRVGYHFGIWARKEFFNQQFYIQPEVQFTHTKSTYIDFLRTDYTLNNLNIPVLLGKRLLNFLSVHVGPVVVLNLDSGFKDANSEVQDITTDSFGLALNAGINIELGKFGLDIRWERGLSKTQSTILNETIIVDSRSNQMVAAISYKIN